MSDVQRQAAHEQARDEAIRDFLRGRPDFVRGDPALMAALDLRPAQNVIDFAPIALSRAAEAHRRESHVRRRIEATAQANFEAQSKVHDAALEVLSARNNSDLAHRLDEVAKSRFGLAAAAIALEGPGGVPAGWRGLLAGEVDAIIGAGRPCRMGASPQAAGLFAANEAIASTALLRLSLWNGPRSGLLAFGSGDPHAFTPDMGHELIDFLARVVERTAERWPAS